MFVTKLLKTSRMSVQNTHFVPLAFLSFALRFLQEKGVRFPPNASASHFLNNLPFLPRCEARPLTAKRPCVTWIRIPYSVSSDSPVTLGPVPGAFFCFCFCFFPGWGVDPRHTTELTAQAFLFFNELVFFFFSEMETESEELELSPSQPSFVSLVLLCFILLLFCFEMGFPKSPRLALNL